MNHIFEGAENQRIVQARESYSGRLLSNDQFDEAIAITGIVEKQIQKTGTFKDKLGDYANAFARSEKFNMIQAETILRDLFKIRTGKTMNQMRETLIAQEEKLMGLPYARSGNGEQAQDAIEPSLSERGKNSAYQAAAAIGDMIEQGDKISFFRAYTHQASQLAQEFGVTEMGARRLMREEFKAVEGQELMDWGKQLEDTYYKPQIEAEKQARQKPSTTRSDDKNASEEIQADKTVEQNQMSFDRSR
jgi:hypothetical protein